ncbi:MarR family winged helix-turn-helix transcriptional regulator [Streptosporangium sp. NPDC001559]|uniref:MarR family winged helix-turn-helix transcriptional regulator n=1 Tax=Streptosporangium sp. NPDC001559 TaxID=3366187 RepID=UPI0036E2AE10
MSTWSAERRISAATGYLLLRLGGLVRDRVEDELRRWRITGKELRVMSLAHDREASQRDLCELSGLDRTTMVAVVDKLERLGYARRARSAADRRKQLVLLTEEGRRAVEEAVTRMTEVEADFLSPLDPAERELLNEMIARLYTVHGTSRDY